MQGEGFFSAPFESLLLPGGKEKVSLRSTPTSAGLEIDFLLLLASRKDIAILHFAQYQLP